MPTKYNLSLERDAYFDGTVAVLVLPKGYRFSDELIHVRVYPTMNDLIASSESDVIECQCHGCDNL
jgi:hypothetical protein